MKIYLEINKDSESPDAGKTLQCEMQTCPQKGESVMIGGREFRVSRVTHCITYGIGEALRHGQTTVEIYQ